MRSEAIKRADDYRVFRELVLLLDDELALLLEAEAAFLADLFPELFTAIIPSVWLVD